MQFQDWFVQSIGFIPSVICLSVLQCDNRRRILAVQTGCCILWAIHYGLLGAWTGVPINLVGIFRSFLCFSNEKDWAKSRFWPCLLIGLYFASTLLTWNGPFGLLPFFSMSLTTIGLWTHHMKLTRLLFLFNSPPLIVYNLIVGSYSCAVVEIFAFLSFIIAILRFDVKQRA